MTRLPIPVRGLALAAFLLALSGCAGNPSPSLSVPSGNIDLPADSPGPMADEDFLMALVDMLKTDDLQEIYPAEMFTETEDGASYTAFAFLHQVSEAYATRDASQLYALSSRECEWCTGHWRLVMDSAGQNVRITGGEFLTDDVFEVERTENGNVAVSVGALRTEVVYWRRDGTAMERVPEERVEVEIRLAYRDGRWFVEEVSLVLK